MTLADALGDAGVGDFAAGAGALLDALGYRSDRVAGGQSGDAGDFVRQFPALVAGTMGERDFLREVESVRILFQVTDSEIAAAVGQPGLLDDGAGGGFDTGNARSFLFAAVELGGDTYSRSGYSAFTREINKRIQMPTVVLFRTGAGSITLAFVHRRVSRVDADRDVLGRVALVREIDAANPHRAHLEILGKLALAARLDWMAAHGKSRNFDGLLDAWLAALDTEELNRRFYEELYAWFNRALEIARFPTGERVTLSPEDHTIRLITRLLFVWFLKEKGLVAGELFVEHQAALLLKDYDRDDGDSYYRAILQNLFFATLNTEIGQRRFSKQNRDDHREPSLYRYRGELADPDRLVALLGQTPFVNGGLFDCLDSFDATGRGGYRMDCFSDVHYGKLSIPNRLFFGGDDAADSSNPGNPANPSNTGEPGLIDLLERYMFTVEENTPVEQEVALDPELLGKVFENLLAAVNPETSVTVRKETGSYYTPRPVVDYMVDEALVGALASGDWDGVAAESIRRLLDYDDALADADTLFDGAERERIIRAIADLRVIDPAVGSGAFPMGILHKLTLALRRLDRDNSIWEKVQQEQAVARAAAAFGTDDEAERNAELVEISAIFERYRDSDYGRKLYLIQNCIYGVDIQPIAVQIAKLRFFISLAIEQESNPYAGAAADNYGIRPLPNLETRLVAADTLRGLEQSAQGVLQTEEVKRLEREISANRERYFHAVNRAQKLHCRNEDARLRQDLAAALEEDGFPTAAAQRIAAWDPFDQNAGKADWFDPKYMFGVSAGFDIVIANPPYGITVKDQRSSAIGHTDSYTNFMGRASELAPYGIMAYITPTSWETGERFKKFRQYLFGKMALQSVVNLPYDVFGTPYVDTAITIGAMGKPPPPEFRLATLDKRAELDLTQIASYLTTVGWPAVASDPKLRVPLLDWAADLFGRVGATATPLGEITSSKRGIEAYQFAILSNREAGALPFFGGQVRRYTVQQPLDDSYVVVLDRESPYHSGQRIWTRRIVNRANRLMSAQTGDDFVVKKDIYVTKPNFNDQHKLAALLAILNSSLMSFLYLSRSAAAVKDDFRQVTLAGLRELPIIFPDAKALAELAQLVASRENQEGVVADLERRIDAIIYRTYGVTESEQDEIAKWLARSG